MTSSSVRRPRDGADRCRPSSGQPRHYFTMILVHMVAFLATSPLLLVSVESKARQCGCSEVKHGGSDGAYLTVCRSTACIPEWREKLQLQGAGISGLSRQTLGAGQKLRYLSIQGSSLASLPGDLLTDAKGLEYLELSYDDTLKALPEDLLQPLNRLEVLVLRNLTGLSTLPKHFLATNARLKKLIIQNVPRLTELDLNLSSLSDILEELVVSGTSVETLDLRGISSAVSLSTLDLSRNHLRELPQLADFLKGTHKLGRLSLSGNRWDCMRLSLQGTLTALMSGSGILFDNGADCADPPPCSGMALTSPVLQKCLVYHAQHHSGSLTDVLAGVLSETPDVPPSTTGQVKTPPSHAPPHAAASPSPEVDQAAAAAGAAAHGPQDLSDSDTDALFSVLGDLLKSPPPPPTLRPAPPPTLRPAPPPTQQRPLQQEDLAAVLPKLEQTLKEILESTEAAAPAPQEPPSANPTPPSLHELEKTLSALLPLLRDIVRKEGAAPEAPAKTPPPAVVKQREKAAALAGLLELLQAASKNDFADVQLLMSECEDDPAKSAAKGGRREVFINVGAIFHTQQPVCSKT